jgi:hypothetical protein
MKNNGVVKKIKKQANKLAKQSLPQIEKKIAGAVDKAISKHLTKSNLTKASQMAGTAVGKFFGSQMLGRTTTNAFSKLIGNGDYNVVRNGLIHAGPLSEAPSFSDGDNGYEVAFSEYLGDIFSGTLVAGTTTFNN